MRFKLMGGSSSRSCNTSRGAIPAFVVEFGPNDPIGKEVSRHTGYNHYGRCNVGNAYTTYRNNAKDVEYRKPASPFNGAYDTGKYCTAGNKCAMNGAFGGVALNTSNGLVADADLTAYYLTGSPPSYEVAVGAGSGTREIGSGNYNENIYRKAPYREYTKPIKAQTVAYPYTGEFKKMQNAGPIKSDMASGRNDHGNTYLTTMKHPDTIWLYHTTSDIHFFSNEVFADWLYLIQTEGALKLMLSEIRDMISNELVLMNKIHTHFGPYVRALNRKEVSFVDLPFGAPMIRMPNSNVVPFKYYHAEFTVDNGVDAENVKYDKAKKHCNVVNAIRPNVKSSTYKPINYLDEVYTTMNRLCKLDKCITDNIVLAVTIPNRGCQLYEAISDFKDKGSTQRIGKGTNLVSVIPITTVESEDNKFSVDSGEKLTDGGKTVLPKVIVKFGSELSGTISTAYDLLSKDMNVHVPIINAKTNGNEINVTINTSSEDKDNKIYVYSAKSANALGSFIAKGKSQINSKSATTMNIINIDYDGNETKVTPNIIAHRFETTIRRAKKTEDDE